MYSKQLHNTLISINNTMIPNSVLTSKLSHGAKVVYALLAMYAQQKSHCPSQMQLAKAAHCTERTIRTYLNELRDTGFVNWEQHGLTKTNIYFFKNRIGE